MKNRIKLFGNLNRARSTKAPLLIIALVALIGFTFALTFTSCDNGTGGGGNGTTGGEDNLPTSTAPDVGTGTQASRKYRVEVYTVNSATYTHMRDTYGGKAIEDLARAAVISRGYTATNTYTNQSFSDVISKFQSAADSIGCSSGHKTTLINQVTEALQTYNESGTAGGFYAGSNYRVYYVDRTSTGKYTVELYTINSATYDYVKNTYGGKTIWELFRADTISRGGTLLNTYTNTNQSFSDVISKFQSAADSIGHSGGNTTTLINQVTEALQTRNQSATAGGFYAGSNYRVYYVKQQ